MKEEIPKVKLNGRILPLKKEYNTFNFKPNIDGRCCEDVVVDLSPYDVLRLSKRLGLSLKEFRLKYTKWVKKDKKTSPCSIVGQPKCTFLDDKGRCSVYKDRPSVCRFFPLGIHRISSKETYYVVSETWCSCTKTKQRVNIGEYIDDSGLRDTLEMDEMWMDLKLKMNRYNLLDDKKLFAFFVKIIYEFDEPDVVKIIEGKVGKLSEDPIEKVKQVIKAAEMIFL